VAVIGATGTVVAGRHDARPGLEYVRMKKSLLLLISLLFLVACGSGGEAIINQAGDELPSLETTVVPPTVDSSAPTVGDSTPIAIDTSDPTMVRERDWKKGNPDDPALTIVEYADFQCPGCASFAPLLSQIASAYPEDVLVVYRHFPLNSIHPNAQKSAEAAEAAGGQGKFWEYHDILFSRQQEWSSLNQNDARAYFIDMAEELGLDIEQFTADLDDGVYADYVAQSEMEAVALGMPGTPSAIVNGQPVPGEGLPRDFETWENFIKEEISLKNLESNQYASAPEMNINTDARYLAHLEMESGQTFTIELLPKSAPLTVNSFVFLAREGYFDGVTFHRVLPGFVAQTGDPTGTGRGGPGYLLPNEIDPALSHDTKGVVAMANAGPDTNGSQWYITYGDVSQLDGSYTIFGRVTEGMEAVEGITPRDPSRSANLPPGDKIARVTIEEIAP
jgi:cyclophilin family peptidyl-prolyl cis-trans isomerase/protein-disulfide isomerase